MYVDLLGPAAGPVLALAAGAPVDPFPSVTPATIPIPGLGPAATTLLGWLRWALLIGGVAGLLICGIMMAVGRRYRSTLAADGAAGIPWVLGGLALGSAAFIIVGAILPAP